MKALTDLKNSEALIGAAALLIAFEDLKSVYDILKFIQERGFTASQAFNQFLPDPLLFHLLSLISLGILIYFYHQKQE